jgi:hypothetical protein
VNKRGLGGTQGAFGVCGSNAGLHKFETNKCPQARSMIDRNTSGKLERYCRGRST